MFELSATKLQRPRVLPTANLLQHQNAIVINFCTIIPTCLGVTRCRMANILHATTRNRVVKILAIVSRLSPLLEKGYK